MKAVLLDEPLGQRDDAERQRQACAETEQRGNQAVQPAFYRQQQDHVAAAGSKGAADAELGAPLERHQREHQHDQQHAAEQRERTEHHEQVGEGATPAVGLVLRDTLHVDNPKAVSAGRGRRERGVTTLHRTTEARGQTAEHGWIGDQGLELGIG